ncbi:plasmid IncI1-type surface exclusion protein ExcA [Candidatus Fukatsuia symbiotica]|uniref:Surface exclusion protein n=1 Tax=Candidatus Fukatsuia symbiotica TaxID=1878942 RepID=A0A2U8IBI1_9GAMM|nr:plasmid IncI1-type surface exclusion protein ExcA [Candidatus Fukatsuia symbiotica]AWK15725.1 surface exclusion protein [Candidatus Fukatsuia symbiotica]MEA9446089.1 plasmid IncI1-type surface exclusion protein ExcA [Candidatus Fukatsuia symbiotica]
MRNKKTIGGALIHLTLFFYVWAGIPMLLFYGVGFMLVTNDYRYFSVKNESIILSQLCWAALLIPLLWCIIRYINKRRRIAKILATIKSDESYDPTPDNEIREMHSSAYFGIDTKRGTMLYIRLFNKKEIDIFGFNINNWRHCELTGTNKLRFYINSTEVPFIDIQHRRAWLLYEKICVMKNQQYDYPYNFPGYVKHNTERLSERMGFKMLPC